jgi:hypothetical protein
MNLLKRKDTLRFDFSLLLLCFFCSFSPCLTFRML